MEKAEVQQELNELNTKLVKLNEFIHSEAFSELSIKQRGWLQEQKLHMTQYVSVLNVRLNNWET